MPDTPHEPYEGLRPPNPKSVSDGDYDTMDPEDEGMESEETDSGKQPEDAEHTFGSDVRVGRIRDWAWQHYIPSDHKIRKFKAACRHCSTLVSSRHDRLRAHLQSQHPDLLDTECNVLFRFLYCVCLV